MICKYSHLELLWIFFFFFAPKDKNNLADIQKHICTETSGHTKQMKRLKLLMLECVRQSIYFHHLFMHRVKRKKE